MKAIESKPSKGLVTVINTAPSRRTTEAMKATRTKAASAHHRIQVEPPDGWVIKFALKFATGSQVYNYAALKVGGRWFTTGRTCPPGGYSWPRLCEFIDGEDLVRDSIKIWEG